MKWTAVAVPAVLAATILAPAASANMTVSNTAGNVRCEVVTLQDGRTNTICVSDTARQTQPECNPPEHLIPAIEVGPGYVGRKCWNQGFEDASQPMQTMQVRSHGSAHVLQGFSGNLYVLDTARMALVRAGSANTVLFSLF